MKRSFQSRKAAFSDSLVCHCTWQPGGHPLIGRAEDEEGAGFWNGHCFLFQLQLSQGARPGAHWDLRFIFLIIPYGRQEKLGVSFKLCSALCFHAQRLPRSPCCHQVKGHSGCHSVVGARPGHLLALQEADLNCACLGAGPRTFCKQGPKQAKESHCCTFCPHGNI